MLEGKAHESPNAIRRRTRSKAKQSKAKPRHLNLHARVHLQPNRQRTTDNENKTRNHRSANLPSGTESAITTMRRWRRVQGDLVARTSARASLSKSLTSRRLQSRRQWSGLSSFTPVEMRRLGWICGISRRELTSSTWWFPIRRRENRN